MFPVGKYKYLIRCGPEFQTAVNTPKMYKQNRIVVANILGKIFFLDVLCSVYALKKLRSASISLRFDLSLGAVTVQQS